jgi:solute carrier family 39 (zinc transporter), member 1/2/3
MHIPKLKKSEAMLSYLNCFSAGMFLAIALIHMMPESVEQHREWALHEELEEPFPLPYCMMFVGYLIVLLVDRVIMHKFMHKHVGHHHHNEDNQCVIEPASTAVCAHDQKIPDHMPHVHKSTP